MFTKEQRDAAEFSLRAPLEEEISDLKVKLQEAQNESGMRLQRMEYATTQHAKLMVVVDDLRDSLAPDTLEAIADEIQCFEHSARSDSLRVIAKHQRKALEPLSKSLEVK